LGNGVDRLCRERLDGGWQRTRKIRQLLRQSPGKKNTSRLGDSTNQLRTAV
jgi:hypothetical protein